MIIAAYARITLFVIFYFARCAIKTNSKKRKGKTTTPDVILVVIIIIIILFYSFMMLDYDCTVRKP